MLVSHCQQICPTYFSVPTVECFSMGETAKSTPGTLMASFFKKNKWQVSES